MANKRTLHGLSLSLCIRDILEGKVQEDQVALITAGTCARTEAEWDRVRTDYCKGPWRKDPERALAILARLRDERRLEQPRVFGEEPPSTYDGYWQEVPFFEVGKTYKTLDGRAVRIIAESTTRGYETVQGDDCGPEGNLGWRYNRIGDLGRATGSPVLSPNSLVPGAIA